MRKRSQKNCSPSWSSSQGTQSRSSTSERTSSECSGLSRSFKPVAALKERLRPEHSELVLSLVEDLLWVPWELLHDGEQFFCERFRMGRLVDRMETQRRALTGRNDEKRDGPGAIVALGSVKGLKFKDEKENVLARLKEMYDGYAQSLPDKSVDEMLLLLDKGFEVFHFVGHGKH